MLSTFPPGFEEVDDLRSRFVREMTLRQLQDNCRSDDVGVPSRTGIPRSLVQFWHDLTDVPPDVRRCLNSWDRLRDEGFVLQLFDDASAVAFIADRYGPDERAAFESCTHPAMRSDYFRMCFIFAEGGLYVDADDVLVGDGWEALFVDAALKVQALCYDIPARGMVPASDLRRTDLPTAGRIFYVNNNPIAAPAAHPVLERALAHATAKLLDRRQPLEIQSTTGPGNLTAALAAHARDLHANGNPPDFEILFDWELTAEPCWDLAYRNDARNWRYMDGQ